MGDGQNFSESCNSSFEEQYYQWGEHIQNNIKKLHHELTNPLPCTDKTAASIWEYQTQLQNLFLQGLDLANQKYTYFEEKKREMHKVAKEYSYVTLEDKDARFLKLFRKKISESIYTYNIYLEELCGFADEFSNPFAQFCKKGAELSYMESRAKESKKLKKYCSETENWMTYIINALITLRRKAFHVMQDQVGGKEKH